MSSEATKFKSRAPRYTLNASDYRFIRFAHQNNSSQTYTTRFVDISLTGLAFVTDRDVSPNVSDLIKIEIPIDEKQPIAWWARVVRVEEYQPHKWHIRKAGLQDENQVLVAVTFHELPAGHARVVHEALEKKFQELYVSERQQKMQNTVLYFAENIWRIFLYLLCALAVFWFLYYFSQPDLVYKKGKGAPWGQRYRLTF